MAWSFTNLGTVAEVEGDSVGARQMYQEGQTISRDLGDRRALAWAKNLLGSLGWSTGDYKEAAQYYEEGLSLYQEVEDLRGEAWTLDLMGNLRLAMEEDLEAEKCYLKSYSLVLKEGVNHQNIAFRNFYHMADVAQFRSQWDDAKEKFTKALASFRRLGDDLGQVSAPHPLGGDRLPLSKESGSSGKLFPVSGPIVPSNQFQTPAGKPESPDWPSC